jgi:hypothetical protein
MDRYAVQDLVRRLQVLEKSLAEKDIPTNTIKDAIKYICEKNKV